MLDVVPGSTGVQVVFRLAANDADLIGRRLGEAVPADIIACPSHQNFARLMIEREQTRGVTRRLVLHPKNRRG